MTTPLRRDFFEPVPVKVRSFQRLRQRVLLAWTGSDARLGRVRAEARRRGEDEGEKRELVKLGSEKG